MNDRHFHLALAKIPGKRIPALTLRHLFHAVVSQELDTARQAVRNHFREVKAQAVKSLGRIITGEMN